MVRMVGDECSYTESDFLEIGKMISVSLYTKVTTKYLPDSWYLIVKQNVLAIAIFILISNFTGIFVSIEL